MEHRTKGGNRCLDVVGQQGQQPILVCGNPPHPSRVLGYSDLNRDHRKPDLEQIVEALLLPLLW